MHELCRIGLMLELHYAYGLGQDEAASLAVAVPLEVWAEVVESEGDRWLWASRPPDGKWSVSVITRDEAARLLRVVDPKVISLCLPLARVAERVMTTVVEHQPAGHA